MLRVLRLSMTGMPTSVPLSCKLMAASVAVHERVALIAKVETKGGVKHYCCFRVFARSTCFAVAV